MKGRTRLSTQVTNVQMSHSVNRDRAGDDQSGEKLGWRIAHHARRGFNRGDSLALCFVVVGHRSGRPCPHWRAKYIGAAAG